MTPHYTSSSSRFLSSNLTLSPFPSIIFHLSSPPPLCPPPFNVPIFSDVALPAPPRLRSISLFLPPHVFHCSPHTSYPPPVFFLLLFTTFFHFPQLLFLDLPLLPHFSPPLSPSALHSAFFPLPPLVCSSTFIRSDLVVSYCYSSTLQSSSSSPLLRHFPTTLSFPLLSYRSLPSPCRLPHFTFLSHLFLFLHPHFFTHHFSISFSLSHLFSSHLKSFIPHPSSRHLLSCSLLLSIITAIQLPFFSLLCIRFWPCN